MSYEQTFVTRIIRKKHKVTFRQGELVARVVNDLLRVPSEATVDEVEFSEDGGIVSMTFHQEFRDPDYRADQD